MIRVRTAPANPERTYLTLRIPGKIVKSFGSTYSAVSSAITPIINPKRAMKANIFNLPAIFNHLGKPSQSFLLGLTYKFVSIIKKGDGFCFNGKLKP
jgi:hypothetical protein